MDNLRTRLEPIIDEIIEDQNKARAKIMRLEADKLELQARVAKLTSDLAVAKSNLAALHQDVTFEADFELDD